MRVLLAGGFQDAREQLESKLAEHGVVIEEHWVKPDDTKGIPKSCQAVLILIDLINKDTANRLRLQAIERSLPVAVITRKWSYSLGQLVKAGIVSQSKVNEAEAVKANATPSVAVAVAVAVKSPLPPSNQEMPMAQSPSGPPKLPGNVNEAAKLVVEALQAQGGEERVGKLGFEVGPDGKVLVSWEATKVIRTNGSFTL